MHSDAFEKELAQWAGYGDKFLEALQLMYVLRVKNALETAVETAMGDHEGLGESRLSTIVQKPLVYNLVVEEKKKSADTNAGNIVKEKPCCHISINFFKPSYC